MQDNRDKRVELLQQYARRFFPATRFLDYALTIERYTLTKAPNLVLNVDGCIGALFLDLLHSSRMFTEAEIQACAPVLLMWRLPATSLSRTADRLVQRCCCLGVQRHFWRASRLLPFPRQGLACA